MMFDLIRAYQLDIMLVLCGACAILTVLLLFTRFLSNTRKRILIFMELIALFLLWFDRLAYIYAGDLSLQGYIWVRVSNFMVFLLTSAIVLGFSLYLMDLLRDEGQLKVLPKRLYFTAWASVFGMVLSVIAVPTKLYYYFDEANLYHRGPGFLIAYVLPVLCPILQYTVIRQYRKRFSRLIYASLALYVFVPIGCGILQVFTYGLSIVNMAMVAVSLSLYIFMYLDLNNRMEHAHRIELQSMHTLFDQTATAFVQAVEKKDDFTRGNALKTAQYAKKIAELAGKSEEECEKVYYAALLHDVGLIGIPDDVIKDDADPDKFDFEAIRKKPEIGAEILSSIAEYPYLAQGAHYSHERYNGTGYPEGLKGEAIPEIARIIAVADAYVTMTSKKRYREAHPDFEAREAFVKGAGESFDPVFADLMVKLIDSKNTGAISDTGAVLEEELTCFAYRDNHSAGIPVMGDYLKLSFTCEKNLDPALPFSAPSIVLFDAYDGRVHDNKKAIKSYHYLEYGEIWFDKYSVTTAARRIEETILRTGKKEKNQSYEIVAGRFEDHLSLVMRSPELEKEVIVALPGNSNTAYIALTGENCRIKSITVEPAGKSVLPGEIRRLVERVSYIEHMESDLPNVQVDRPRSACSKGIELGNRLMIEFHTMTLPGADLVWHCPYVVIYSSADGQVGGEGYREYALVKLNGENEVAGDYAENRFHMKHKEDFPGWDGWKDANHKGMDCSLAIEKKDVKIVLKTENLGISIENTTILREKPAKIYVALTGDEVALTDIRVDGN